MQRHFPRAAGGAVPTLPWERLYSLVSGGDGDLPAGGEQAQLKHSSGSGVETQLGREIAQASVGAPSGPHSLQTRPRAGLTGFVLGAVGSRVVSLGWASRDGQQRTAHPPLLSSWGGVPRGGTLSEPEELAGRLQSLSAIPVTCWGLAQAAVSGLRGLLSLKFPSLRFSQGGWTRPGA